MPASFVLIPDQREEDRWFRAGTPSCMANSSVPLKQASHCLLVSRERSETHEGRMGDRGESYTNPVPGRRAAWSPAEECLNASLSFLKNLGCKVLLLFSVWIVSLQIQI